MVLKINQIIKIRTYLMYFMFLILIISSIYHFSIIYSEYKDNPELFQITYRENVTTLDNISINFDSVDYNPDYIVSKDITKQPTECKDCCTLITTYYRWYNEHIYPLLNILAIMLFIRSIFYFIESRLENENKL